MLLLALAAAKPDPETFHRLGRHLTVLGVELHKDTLANVQNRLGVAEVRRYGDAAASGTGLCYVGADGTVLAFISVNEMGEGRQLVTDFHLASKESMVVYSPAAPGYVVPPSSRPRCSQLRKLSRGTATLGGLRLGMTTAQVTKMLGRPTEASPEALVYLGEKDDASGVRSLRLQLAGSVVTGILAELDVL